MLSLTVTELREKEVEFRSQLTAMQALQEENRNVSSDNETIKSQLQETQVSTPNLQAFPANQLKRECWFKRERTWQLYLCSFKKTESVAVN